MAAVEPRNTIDNNGVRIFLELKRFKGSPEGYEALLQWYVEICPIEKGAIWNCSQSGVPSGPTNSYTAPYLRLVLIE